MTRIQNILQLLINNNIEFVIIGGVAAVAHGSAYSTSDLDICYSRSMENLKKLSDTLYSINAKLRNAPPDIPFTPDVPTLKSGLNFAFVTALGDFDILGEVGGIGFYQEVKNISNEDIVFGLKCFVLDLDGLLASKKFAGRGKDKPVIIELEALKELKQKK